MKFWNGGPNTIWHNLPSDRFVFQKSLHPNVRVVVDHADILSIYSTLLEKFWPISLYLTDDAIAKLCVTQSLVK